VNVYGVPLVRPVTEQLVAPLATHDAPPGDAVTVYELIAAPPLLDGAVHDTTDWLLAAPVATTPVGAPGTTDGTTAEDAVEAEPVPDTFVAVTLKEYAMPLVRPVTVQGFERPHENDACATMPTNGVTVYPMTPAPPFDTGAVHDTTEREFSADVATTPVGAPGTVDGTIDLDAVEAEPVPDTFVALTVNV